MEDCFKNDVTFVINEHMDIFMFYDWENVGKLKVASRLVPQILGQIVMNSMNLFVDNDQIT